MKPFNRCIEAPSTYRGLEGGDVTYSTAKSKKTAKFSNATQQTQNYRRSGQTLFDTFIRLRPLFLQETLHNPNPVIEVIDRESVILNQDQNGFKQLAADKLFRCTRTLPPCGKTSAIFNPSGLQEFVTASFKGVNQAVFITGGKSSGKTHTLIGNISDPGLCLMVARTIFFEKERCYPSSRVFCSFIGFDNNFKDLLTYTGYPLEHRSTSFGSYLPGLSQFECGSMLSFLTLLKTALIIDGKRDINRFSILTIGQGEREKSTDLYLVDCESFESMEQISTKGVNNAMLTFNNCLRAVFEINTGIRQTSFVPYDQSPFTSFFKEYLGGKAKTYIIGAISPYSGHLEVTPLGSI